MTRKRANAYRMPRCAAVAIALSAGLILCGAAGALAEADCTCATAKVKGGWCTACKVGFLAGVKIESWMMFETLDAHGHDIDPAVYGCATCKKARETDGYCDSCHIGFVRKMGYFSRLTYHLAKGQAQDVSKISCPTCRKHAEKYGWCDSCKAGMVGNVMIKDVKDYEHASKAFQRLLSAIPMLRQCESCAVAFMCDGFCPKCNIDYKDGKKVNRKEPG